MEFEWDEDKRRRNVERHGYDFLDGVLVFAGEYYCRYFARFHRRVPERRPQQLGASEQMLLARRELQQSVFPAKGVTIVANRSQREFWDELERASRVSASAPTASGKTYLVL
jgi:uncharacterized DUF497 family protein